MIAASHYPSRWPGSSQITTTNEFRNNLISSNVSKERTLGILSSLVVRSPLQPVPLLEASKPRWLLVHRTQYKTTWGFITTLTEAKSIEPIGFPESELRTFGMSLIFQALLRQQPACLPPNNGGAPCLTGCPSTHIKGPDADDPSSLI